jgi:hypothetical protein
MHGKDYTYPLRGGVHPNGKQLKLFAFVYNGGILAT